MSGSAACDFVDMVVIPFGEAIATQVMAMFVVVVVVLPCVTIIFRKLLAPSFAKIVKSNVLKKFEKAGIVIGKDIFIDDEQDIGNGEKTAALVSESRSWPRCGIQVA